MKFLLLLASGVVAVAALAGTSHAHADALDLAAARKACQAGARRTASDPRIAHVIAIAREQHRLFGGQTIAPDGGMTIVGYNEAEYDHGKDDATPSWQRVAEYWRTLGPEEPSSFRSGQGRKFSRKDLLDRIAKLQAAQSSAGGLDDARLGAVSDALLRSAIIDHPWSAAFISYLMRKGGFAAAEFHFSDAHADYVERAFEATRADIAAGGSPYAYRACDVRTTPPRPGDLLCYTREDSSTADTFARLAGALAVRAGASFPMHCDLVVAADTRGDSKLEAIGGNVHQSVTLRRMYLNAEKRLGTSYIATGPAQPCGDASRCPGHLHRKPWVTVLQFRN